MTGPDSVKGERPATWTPDRRVAFRCLIPALVVSLIAGLGAISDGTTDAVLIWALFSGMFAAFCLVRMWIWLRGVAGVSLVVDGDNVVFMRGTRSLDRVRLAAGDRVTVVRGDRWPEWTRVALFVGIGDLHGKRAGYEVFAVSNGEWHRLVEWLRSEFQAEIRTSSA